jgi:hypothetical protein
LFQGAAVKDQPDITARIGVGVKESIATTIIATFAETSIAAIKVHRFFAAGWLDQPLLRAADESAEAASTIPTQLQRKSSI